MDEHSRTDYQVRRRESRGAGSSSDSVLAWGTDDVTGQPRYILEFTREQTGEACKCHCEVCGTALLAVNAGKTVYRRRPHFRHKAGVEHEACLLAAGRAALLAALAGIDHVTLPGHRRDARVTGLSGHVYEAWCELPPEPARIADCAIVDKACAVVRLDDGREFRVLLVGGQSHGGAGGAAVEIVVDDPALAMLSPEELRSRMRLYVSGGNWCSHWKDEQIAADATQAAIDLAVDAIDYGSSNRESALHKAAKEVLAQARRIMVPALRLAGGNLVRPFTSLELEDVELEQPLGEIRPDLKARTVACAQWPTEDLLVEVTVSNGIDVEREARIKRRNLPALEIDLSRLAGRLSMAEFGNLVVNEVVGKRWIHHPALEEAERDFQRRREEAARMAAERAASEAARALAEQKTVTQRSGGAVAALPESREDSAVRRPRVPPVSKIPVKAAAPVADARLGKPPFLLVPDLTASVNLHGMPEPYRQVIRSAYVLEALEIQLVSSSVDAAPALRLETIAAPRWPAGTLFVELATTGVPDPARRARIRERGFATLVVDARGVDPGGLDEMSLTSLVFDARARKRWVFHPAIDEYVRRLKAAQQSQRGGRAPRQGDLLD